MQGKLKEPDILQDYNDVLEHCKRLRDLLVYKASTYIKTVFANRRLSAVRLWEAEQAAGGNVISAPVIRTSEPYPGHLDAMTLDEIYLGPDGEPSISFSGEGENDFCSLSDCCPDVIEEVVKVFETVIRLYDGGELEPEGEGVVLTER